MSDKSYVTMLVCPWCKKPTNELALDRRLRDTFEMYTESNRPCDDCMKDAIILIDYKTEKLVGYVKKELVLNKESLEQFKGTPVKALVKQTIDGFQIIEKEE